MNLRVILRTNPKLLPEGMTAQDLLELVEVPFERGCAEAFNGLRSGPSRDALVLASAPVILHEALVRVGVNIAHVIRYRVQAMGRTIELSARWAQSTAGTLNTFDPFDAVRFTVFIP